MSEKHGGNASHIDKIFHYGNFILRIALVAVILSMTISTLLLLIYGRLQGKEAEWYSIFVWYSLTGAMWIFTSAPAYLLVMAIYSRYSRKVLPVKKQFVMLLFAILVAIIFIVTAVVLKVWSE